MAQDEAITVLVSGAAGQIGYSLIPMIASGQMFGPNTPVVIHALEVNFDAVKQRLNGVAMELQDCGYPLLRGFKQCFVGVDDEGTWAGIDYAVLVGGFPRKAGMTRGDLLKKNKGIFKGAGECMEKYCKASVKTLVVANPANTNCRMLAEYAKKIPKENFSALTRLDFNRAVGIIASREGCSNPEVKNVVIWGNHSKSQVPDVTNCTIGGKKLLETTKTREYYTSSNEGDFMHTVQYRGAAVIKERGSSSACSAGNAACNHVRNWHLGTAEGEFTSMAVWSNGNPYGIADDIFYSFPCSITDGKWTIEQVPEPNETVRALMTASQDELKTEWTTANE